MVAIGQALVIISGGIDLSVGFSNRIGGRRFALVGNSLTILPLGLQQAS